MNSKETLEDIRDYHNETVIDNYCTYVENDFEEELNIIEKDLELLDIIKVLIKKGDIVVNSDLFVDYPELYEWLEQNNRLTKDLYNQYKDYWYREDLDQVCDREQIVLTKLGQLEDIEEDIRFDLIKAVKLCKQVNKNKVVYTKEKWGIDTLELLDELDIELFNHRLYGGDRGIYVSLDLYNYGITWALTKEELEQNE